MDLNCKPLVPGPKLPPVKDGLQTVRLSSSVNVGGNLGRLVIYTLSGTTTYPNGPDIAYGYGPPIWYEPSNAITYFMVDNGSIYNSDSGRWANWPRHEDYGMPSWSPDGSKLLFRGSAMEPAWNYEIFVATYADEPYGVDPVNITNHAGADGAPSWSPDGARLVFTRDGDLATMNADGSGLAVLDDAQHVQSPAWSSDGSKLVYVCYIDEPEHRGEICVINSDGSGKTRLTFDTAGDEGPRFVP